jgi:type II secretory pathway component PulJ
MTPTPSSCSRGLTLAEGLLSLALVGLILGLMGGLFQQLSRNQKRLEQREQVVESGLMALEQMRRDSCLALNWHQPSPSNGGLEAALEVDIPDYSQQSVRFPWPLSSTGGTPWQPDEHSLRLRYLVSGEKLRREIRVGGTFQGFEVASGVQGLSVRRVTRSSLQLELSIRVQNQLQPVRQRFELPCRAAWGTF